MAAVRVPYAALRIRNLTGSFSVAFLVIPVLLLVQLVGLWVGKEEHAREDLEAIGV